MMTTKQNLLMLVVLAMFATVTLAAEGFMEELQEYTNKKKFNNYLFDQIFFIFDFPVQFYCLHVSFIRGLGSMLTWEGHFGWGYQKGYDSCLLQYYNFVYWMRSVLRL